MPNTLPDDPAVIFNSAIEGFGTWAPKPPC